MLTQLGGGWGGSAWPKGAPAFSLGVQAGLAFDPALRIFGHVTTGDGMMHVRPYKTMIEPYEGEVQFVGRDGTLYVFQTELEPPLDQVWANWLAATDEHAPFIAVDPEYMSQEFATDLNPSLEG